MIVLTLAQRNKFLEIKGSFSSQLYNDLVDYVPIEIKGGLWILPDNVLNDEKFIKIKNELVVVGEFDKYTNRDINKSELFNTEP